MIAIMAGVVSVIGFGILGAFIALDWVHENQEEENGNVRKD